MNVGLNIPAAPAVSSERSTPWDPGTPEPGLIDARAELPPITFVQPRRIFFGDGCSSKLADELRVGEVSRCMVVTDACVLRSCGEVMESLASAGIQTTVYDGIAGEPGVSVFEECLARAREVMPEAVIGLGGGSAMDTAKLVAALLDGGQSISEVFGVNLLRRRKTLLVCVSTTSGTGSEVSPNAILLDEASGLKKGVVSPFLVPDLAFVDPKLTWSVPPPVTAATGLDALSHCLEAFANKFAHPAVDLYAIQGIRLIAGSLRAAIRNGSDGQARAALALGSLYGGLCLGPVNTGAVHALAYPLGSRYHVAHGISTSVLLPHVLRFNLSAAPERYARIALALGAARSGSTEETAANGIRLLEELIEACPIPRGLSALGVQREVLPEMAASAMTVTRLLRNNPRPLSEADALEVYRAAW